MNTEIAFQCSSVFCFASSLCNEKLNFGLLCRFYQQCSVSDIWSKFIGKNTCKALSFFAVLSHFHWFLIALSLDFQHKKYICCFSGNLSPDLSSMTFPILRIGFQNYFPVSRSGFAVPLFKEIVDPILSTTKKSIRRIGK